MEEALLKIVRNGLTLDSLVLIGQLVIVAFLALWVRGWIRKTWAWGKFKKATLVGIGTPLTVTINGTITITGTITSADKSNVVVEGPDRKAVIKTVKFVGDYDWLIHTSQSKGEA